MPKIVLLDNTIGLGHPGDQSQCIEKRWVVGYDEDSGFPEFLGPLVVNGARSQGLDHKEVGPRHPADAGLRPELLDFRITGQ